MTIIESVGHKAKNNKIDSKVIQAALNLAEHPEFNISHKLSVDGYIGSKTNDVIVLFQKNVLKMANPDGRIDPNGKTLKKLHECIPKSKNLTLDSITAIMAKGSKVKIAKYLPLLNHLLPQYQINTSLRICHFLAQVGHESLSFSYTEEIDDGHAYEGRKDLGNTEKGDGPRFKGRGLIQLTGRQNYSEYAKYSCLDLLTMPHEKIISTSPHYALDVSLWFWKNKNLNKYADRDDIHTLTRRINGGHNGINDRKAYLARAKFFFI